MNFSQLKTAFQSAAAVFGFSLVITACNNSDESANNSTSNVNADTAVAKTDNTSNVVAKKKSGKVSTTVQTEDQSVKIVADNSGYYNRAEVAPSYKGGQGALEDYIAANLEYPKEAIDNNVEGTVRVQFSVDEKGKVENVKTVGDKLGYGLEEEAMKAVANMPNWTPGEVKGKRVKTWQTLPVNYQLQN